MWKQKKKTPVVEERLKFEKSSKETGEVQVRKIVREREEVVDEPLLKEDVEIKRVPVQQYVDGPIPIREENGVIIVPVLEEVLVVEKRLLLREELHLIKQERTVRSPQKVSLRSEEVVVERVEK